ncbi:MAG: hypothetical protein ACXWF2_03285 [Usitatibacter sp.]
MDARSLHNCLRGTIAALLSSSAFAAHAAGVVENPTPGAAVSGISVISGWHCTASRVEIEIDGTTRLPAASGTDRLDTLGVCGKRDTGFGLLLNWAILGPGTHSLRALADGEEFAQRTVTVVSLGAEFLRGKSATITLGDFPAAGKSIVLEWRESAQSFAVREVRDGAPPLTGRWNGANLERRTGCAAAQNNGDRGTYAQYDISIEQGFIGIQESAITGLACTYFGPYLQDGTSRQASGSYTCSDGKRGDFTATSFLVTPSEMSIGLDIKLNTSESCAIAAILGGSRLP